MTREEADARFESAFYDIYQQLRDFFTDNHICDEDSILLCKEYLLANDFSSEED